MYSALARQSTAPSGTSTPGKETFREICSITAPSSMISGGVAVGTVVGSGSGSIVEASVGTAGSWIGPGSVGGAVPSGSGTIVGASAGVLVGCGDSVAAGSGVFVGTEVVGDVGMAPGAAVAVGSPPGVVATAVAVGSWVAVGSGGGVTIGSSVGVTVGTGVDVAVGSGVTVTGS